MLKYLIVKQPTEKHLKNTSKKNEEEEIL